MKRIRWTPCKRSKCMGQSPDRRFAIWGGNQCYLAEDRKRQRQQLFDKMNDAQDWCEEILEEENRKMLLTEASVDITRQIASALAGVSTDALAESIGVPKQNVTAVLRNAPGNDLWIASSMLARVGKKLIVVDEEKKNE